MHILKYAKNAISFPVYHFHLGYPTSFQRGFKTMLETSLAIFSFLGLC